MIGASLNGERGETLDTGWDLTILRVSRIGDDVVGSELRFSGTFSIHGWFLGANANFYGGLGISTLIAGKRF